MPVPIFTISGLRGVFGVDLDSGIALRAARGYGRFVAAHRQRKGHSPSVALARDCRASGPELAAAVKSGLQQAGCRVIDLSICPTPTVPLVVRLRRLAGGVMITASHNPEPWNGLKFFSPSGAFLTPAELAELKRTIRQDATEPTGGQGPRKSRRGAGTDAIGLHIRHILRSRFFRNRPRRKLRIGIDACHGAASVAAVRLVKALGSVSYPLHCSPEKGCTFPRGPEPVAANLDVLSRFVQDKKLDLGIAFDPDGDRFSCVDERGVPLGEEASVMLATDFVLKRSAGDSPGLPRRKSRGQSQWISQPVVVNLSTTQGVDDIARRYGVPVIRTRVGEAAVVARMKEVGASVGGEGNGGVIIPEINTARDGLVALAVLVQTISDSGRLLSAIADELPHHVMLKDKVPARGLSWPAIRQALSREFSGARLARTDGLKVIGPDWWLHVRPSNTEPIMRLIAEARTVAQARDWLRRARRSIGVSPQIARTRSEKSATPESV